MGVTERSKKRVHLWKKAVLHFLLCFVMGFFTGFAPTGKPSFTSLKSSADIHYNRSIELAPRPTLGVAGNNSSVNRSLSETPDTAIEDADSVDRESESDDGRTLNPRKQIIVITPTNDKDPLRGVLLSRMADTLKLVPPPLLWIVVESQLESSDVSQILRSTGVMYRHLVENFTDHRTEMDHQRNLALKHIEHHRLSGIVHFAGLSNVYDLSFFDEIRPIETFGTWPLAKLSTRRKKMIIEGPVCQSSQVVGWHLKNLKMDAEELAIHISGFGFNSSILWDPERWGYLPFADATKQNSLKFVKQAFIEDESKIRGVPSEDCSKVNIWQLHLSSKIVRVNPVPDSSFDGGQR